MNILQTPTFKRKFKKLSPTQKQSVKDSVLKISKDPSIGVIKKGDLSDVRVHKFKILGQEYLLAYSVDKQEQKIILLALGTHENF
jgi:mRNA-degrading endonuclease RelE of RelBE toxin-antitoxin system